MLYAVNCIVKSSGVGGVNSTFAKTGVKTVSFRPAMFANTKNLVSTMVFRLKY